MTQEPHIITDNLDQLLAVLPDGLSDAISIESRASLIEIVLDLGRRPEARFTNDFAYLRESPVTREDLDFVEARLGAFGDDNRAGIPATLHRISAMRNRRGIIVGLTLRVGRAVMGIVDILRDLIESGDSVLLMGRPGLGKTTLLRELARVLADEMGKRVVIVDTSNEIAGDGDVPHPAIGRARRMQVARVQQQHDVMIEAVENHMPEVVVIDEIGRTEETLAARTIAERGVQLVATVHGNTLDNLLANPTMSDLIGGIQAVTLSDEEARRRRTQKTVLERKAPPTFDVIIEMIERDKIAVRRPVLEVVDALLRGQPAPPELRWRDEDGNVQIARPEVTAPSSRFRPDADESGGRRNGSSGNGSGSYGGRGERSGDRSSDRFERRFDRTGGSRFDRSPYERSFNERAYDNAERGERPSRERKGRAFNAINTLPLERELGSGLPATLPAPGDLEDDLRALDATAVELEDLEDDDDEPEMDGSELDDLAPLGTVPAPVDVSRVRRIYPFGVSRSRLARAVKHLGLPLSLARTWQDADAVLMLSGTDGLNADTSLLREARELGLAIISVRGNTYAQILARLNELFTAPGHESHVSARELAIQEARQAIQRVLAEAEPIELRPQAKTLRRLQHQLAQRYHLRSYSVGRDPHRRVRFLPNLGR